MLYWEMSVSFQTLHNTIENILPPPLITSVALRHIPAPSLALRKYLNGPLRETVQLTIKRATSRLKISLQPITVQQFGNVTTHCSPTCLLQVGRVSRKYPLPVCHRLKSVCISEMTIRIHIKW